MNITLAGKAMKAKNDMKFFTFLMTSSQINLCDIVPERR